MTAAAPPLVLGIDPDTKNTGWALATSDRVLRVGTIKSKEQMLRSTAVFLDALFSELGSKGIDLVVVEGQWIYPHSPVRPNDILLLGQTGGGILGQAIALCPGIRTMFPKPEEWKGQRPKKIHQASVYGHYGIQHSPAPGYSYPSGCAKAAAIKGASRLNRGDWKHVGDAVGLALYGALLLKHGLRI